MIKRELFVFWQFNGDNSSYCNLTCPECYGHDGKTYQHYWSGDVAKWEKALVNLDKLHGDSGLYLVYSYGEALGSKGFHECVEMIGRHPSWTLCIVSNLMLPVERLLKSQLVKDRRLFIIASWHPEGVADRVTGWEVFKQHVLSVKAAGVPLHVLYCWYPGIIEWFPEYFDWLDANDIRFSPRRFLGTVGGFKIPFTHKIIGGKRYPLHYSGPESVFLYAANCPKVQKYGLTPVSSKGLSCTAGRDLILVKVNGDVRLCADCENMDTGLGNIFSSDFKLGSGLVKCPSVYCGGDYGMLHLQDPCYAPTPERIGYDTFVSIVEGIKQSSPVVYRNRDKMIEYLNLIREQRKC